ncbi:hypothetical protein [Desulfovibrio inopinatus]|uniref:hypothetical protein n=1 Tax=Desulfovibrio inopinatus TaxID=102109 RepID=UPI000406A868|nr:hypothetical protein [Desulfovibrio inopinatus]
MSTKWTQHDDSTHFLQIGGAFFVTVTYERLGQPGWKVQVGRRVLKDKFANVEDAKKIAIAFADRVITKCHEDLEAAKTESGIPSNES